MTRNRKRRTQTSRSEEVAVVSAEDYFRVRAEPLGDITFERRRTPERVRGVEL